MLSSRKSQVGCALYEALLWPVGRPSPEDLSRVLQAKGYVFPEQVILEALRLREELDSPVPNSFKYRLADLFLDRRKYRRLLLTVIFLGICCGLAWGIPQVTNHFLLKSVVASVELLGKEIEAQDKELADLSWVAVGDLPAWILPRIDALQNGEFSEHLREAKADLDQVRETYSLWSPASVKVNSQNVGEVVLSLEEIRGKLKAAQENEQMARAVLTEARGLADLAERVGGFLQVLELAPERLQESAKEETTGLLQALERREDYTRYLSRLEGLSKTASLMVDFQGQVEALQAQISTEFPSGAQQANALGALAQEAFRNGEYVQALESLSQLRQFRNSLGQTFRLVPSPDSTGSYFYRDESSGLVYVFVRALDASGQPVSISIHDHRTGTEKLVDTWAEQIGPADALILEALMLDGIEKAVAEKQAGDFQPRYWIGPKSDGRLDLLEGRITQW